MRIGIVSDIHCNIAGLKSALDVMGEIDQLLCLGDSIFEYRFSNEVVAELRMQDALVIQGNHEETFFGIGGVRARAAPSIEEDHALWLADQPLRRDIVMDSRRLHLCHSTPWEPRGTYIIPENREMARFGDTDTDVVMYGHTHRQTIQTLNNTLIINPGSAGDARDSSNGRRLSCAVLETDPLSATIIDYDATPL